VISESFRKVREPPKVRVGRIAIGNDDLFRHAYPLRFWSFCGLRVRRFIAVAIPLVVMAIAAEQVGVARRRAEPRWIDRHHTIGAIAGERWRFCADGLGLHQARYVFARRPQVGACASDLAASQFSSKVTPAMAAGVTYKLWEMGDLFDKAFEAAEKRAA
jgi:hypothetical protein